MPIQQIFFASKAASGNLNPPSVAATATTQSTTATGNINVNLPASIASGNLLVLAVGVATSTAITTPTGWTNTKTVAHTTEPIRLMIFTKTADGTEGSTVAVDCNDANLAATAYRITNWQGPLMVSTGVFGQSASPDPDAVTSNYTETKALAIGAIVWLNSNSDLTAYPSNLTLNRIKVRNTADNVGVGSSLCADTFDITNGGTVNPTAGTIDSNRFYCAATLLVRSNG